MRRLMFLSLLIVSILLIGCTSQEGTTWENAQENGLTVGMDAAYRPFEFYNEDGEITGFDAELIEAIGSSLGIEVILQDVSFDGIIPGLQSGEYDLIISAMTITEERAQAVNFSDPYFNAGQVIAVLEDNTSIKSEEDLDSKKVGVQLGTTADLLVSDMEGVEILRYDTIPEAFIDLSNGRVDAVVNDLPVTASYIQEQGRAKIVGEPFTEEFYGMAMRKSDEDLLENINQALAQIKADGTYDQIFAKWFE